MSQKSAQQREIFPPPLNLSANDLHSLDRTRTLPRRHDPGVLRRQSLFDHRTLSMRAPLDCLLVQISVTRSRPSPHNHVYQALTLPPLHAPNTGISRAGADWQSQLTDALDQPDGSLEPNHSVDSFPFAAHPAIWRSTEKERFGSQFEPTHIATSLPDNPLAHVARDG